MTADIHQFPSAQQRKDRRREVYFETHFWYHKCSARDDKQTPLYSGQTCDLCGAHEPNGGNAA